MEKINFKDLPSTDTPINSSNLNQLQTNVENAINGVVESGSNANGSYIKFGDGTMICMNLASCGANLDSVQVTFPQAFINTNYFVTALNRYSNIAGVNWSYGTTTNTTMVLYPRTSAGVLPTVSTVCSYIAIGRWK